MVKKPYPYLATYTKKSDSFTKIFPFPPPLPVLLLVLPACLFFLAAFTQKKTSNYTTKGYIKSQAYTQLTYNQTLLPHQLVSFFLLTLLPHQLVSFFLLHSHKKRQAIVSNHLSIPACLSRSIFPTKNRQASERTILSILASSPLSA